MKKILKTGLFVLLCFGNAFSQPNTVKDTLKPEEIAASKKFVASVLEAHHIYQESTSKKAKEVRKKYGANSLEFKKIIKTDSIFKAARSNINSLLYNMNELDDNNRVGALEAINLYVEEAKKIDNQNQLTLNDVKTTSKKIKENNETILSSYQLDLEGERSKISPNHFLDVKIDFDLTIPLGNLKDFILYLFPSNWIYLEDRLYGADIGNGKNIASFYNTLDYYAHKWTKGMNQRLNNIYTGKFTLIIVNKSKNIITHFQTILIPANKEFKYTISN